MFGVGTEALPPRIRRAKLVMAYIKCRHHKIYKKLKKKKGGWAERIDGIKLYSVHVASATN